MSAKEAFQEVAKIMTPVKGRFLNDDVVEMNMLFINNKLGRKENIVNYFQISENKKILSQVHNSDEVLVGYSKNGDIKAMIRSIQFKKTMPLNTPKVGENVMVLEIVKDGEVLVEEILNDENGNVQKFSTITSGLVWSPNSKYLVWTVSEKRNNEKKSKLGYTVQMFDEKDYGEDIDGVYRTILCCYDMEKNQVRCLGAPENYGSCTFSFASDDVLIVQAVDLSSPRLLGLRSYENRNFNLFAVKLNDENIVYKKIFGKIALYPKAIQIDKNTARIFFGRFADNYGGHNGPVHPATMFIDLNTLEIRDYKESENMIYVSSFPVNPFISNNVISLNVQRRCFVLPIKINLDNFSTEDIINDEVKSIYLDDINNDNYLIRLASINETPRFAILNNGNIKYLTESTKFDNISFKLIINDNYNDAILLIAPEETKKFVVVPHGGPHGMYSTYWNRAFGIFALCGYSVALINYRGSTGYPFEVLNSLPGHCGENDVADVVQIIDQVRNLYKVEKLGIYGYSHGGFLSAHISGQHSDKIDFAVAGGPVIDLFSSYYQCDIPDWPLVEAGLTCETSGKIEITKDSFNALWRSSPIRFAKNVNVPILLVHGHNDRRVSYKQSLEFYYALKMHNKMVKLLIYENNGHSLSLSDASDDFIYTCIEFFDNPIEYINQKE